MLTFSCFTMRVWRCMSVTSQPLDWTLKFSTSQQEEQTDNRDNCHAHPWRVWCVSAVSSSPTYLTELIYLQVLQSHTLSKRQSYRVCAKRLNSEIYWNSFQLSVFDGRKLRVSDAPPFSHCIVPICPPSIGNCISGTRKRACDRLNHCTRFMRLLAENAYWASKVCLYFLCIFRNELNT